MTLPDFFREFLNDIALPLEIDAKTVVTFLQNFEEPDLCAHFAMRTVLKMLLTINEDILRQVRGDEFLCPITLQRMVDPVTASDGFTYERQAIEEWLSTHDSSPCTGGLMTSLTLAPNVELRERIADVDDDNLSRFLEFFIFESVLGNSRLKRSAQLPRQLVADLVVLAAGRLPDGVGDQKFASGLLPTGAACTGILRELVRICAAAPSGEVTSAALSDMLDCEVLASSASTGFFDVPLAISYLTVLEERIGQSGPLDGAGYEFDGFDFTPFVVIPTTTRRSTPTQTLSTIASMRAKLSTFAIALCDEAAAGAVRSGAIESALRAQENGASEALTRSVRLFLLKQIERRKGTSFLRGVLLQPPLLQAEWIREWTMSGDVSFSRWDDDDPTAHL